MVIHTLVLTIQEAEAGRQGVQSQDLVPPKQKELRVWFSILNITINKYTS
jgi:hypothetical protein